jgi:hypothetical protein
LDYFTQGKDVIKKRRFLRDIIYLPRLTRNCVFLYLRRHVSLIIRISEKNRLRREKQYLKKLFKEITDGYSFLLNLIYCILQKLQLNTMQKCKKYVYTEKKLVLNQQFIVSYISKNIKSSAQRKRFL